MALMVLGETADRIRQSDDLLTPFGEIVFTSHVGQLHNHLIPCLAVNHGSDPLWMLLIATSPYVPGDKDPLYHHHQPLVEIDV